METGFEILFYHSSPTLPAASLMQEIWTIQRILNWTLDYFQKHQVPDPRLSAELLLAGVLKLKRLELYLQFEKILTPDELSVYRDYIRRRIKFEPVQYILGEQDFMGLTFSVNPEVLIPRPETELLVEEVLAAVKQMNFSSLKIIDIGTGSGSIAISLAHYCPQAEVVAVDKSQKAIQIAQENARKIGTANVSFFHADMETISLKTLGKADIIVSNPPYVSQQQYQNLHPQVKNYEPAPALLAGLDGLDFYRKLLPRLPEMLNKEGWIFLEIGFEQKNEIQKLLSNHHFKNICFIKDYQDVHRIVKAQI
jgi:release factor glutamine methyltransferase